MMTARSIVSITNGAGPRGEFGIWSLTVGMNTRLTKETLELLQLFQRKSQKIVECSYMKWIRTQGGLKSTTTWKAGGEVTIEHNYPDSESVDAMVLTVRMFIQDNDQISLRNMSKLSDDGLSNGWHAQLSDVRTKLNEELDNVLPWAFNDKSYTLREIVKAFVYGEFAHTDEVKAAQVKDWTKDELFGQIFRSHLQAGLLRLCEAIAYLERIARLEISGDEIPLPNGML